MEDVLSHPSLVRLLDLTGDIKWVYHVAEQILIAESNALDHGADMDYHFDWELDNIDLMFNWGKSPQGIYFWRHVSGIETGWHRANGEKPYFENGKVVYK